MWLLNSERDSSKWAVLVAVAFCALGGGEAAAQLTPDNTFHGNGLRVDVAPRRVAEGASTTIAVTVKASVDANTSSATPVTVTVDVEHESEDATSEPADVSLNPATATLTFPANTTSSPVTHEVSGTIRLQTIHDPDAEDETIVLAIEASGGGFSIVPGSPPDAEPRQTVTLDDDENQSYVLALAPGAAPREGAPFDVVVRADPGPRGRQEDVDAAARRQRVWARHGRRHGRRPDLGHPRRRHAVLHGGGHSSPNDGNRAADRVTVTAYSGTVGDATPEGSASFTVADAHALPAPAAVTVEARNATGGW